jgi:hypothetical protein
VASRERELAARLFAGGTAWPVPGSASAASKV